MQAAGPVLRRYFVLLPADFCQEQAAGFQEVVLPSRFLRKCNHAILRQKII